jgi:Holliday junction resolvase
MSHGPVDVFAAKSGRVLLIQVKSGTSRIKKEEMESLKTFATEFNADAQVWSFRKRGKIQKVTISKRISRRTNKIPKAIVPEPMDTIPIQTVSSLNQSF